MKSKFLALIAGVLIQGCIPVDDYLLGKDNTPKPKNLKEINSQLNIVSGWSTLVGKAHKATPYLKLKPVIQGNTIYTADASGLVQAINKNSGAIKWSTLLKNGIASGPTVANGFIAVGSNSSSLILLNQNNGTIAWENKVSGEILSPPAFSYQKVIAKTIDGKVFAFNTANGKQLWQTEHGSPNLVLKASSSPVIVGNLILIGFSDGKFDALNIQTGQTVWQTSIAYATGASDVERLVDIDADPIVKDKMVYLASYQGYIGALSLDEGQFLWKNPGSVYKNMLFNTNTLYLTDSKDVIWSLNAHTGHVNWKQNVFKARGLTEPALIGPNLVLGDKTGYLHFINAQNGELISRLQLPAGVSTAPVIVGKTLYVLTDNGMLTQLSVN